jgi:hypothetical protein
MSEAATKEVTKELKPISEMVQQMSDKIKAELTFNADGTTVLKDEGIYLTLAKEAELDEATIKKVRVFDDNFNAAANLAVGMGAIPVFVDNKETTEVNATFKMTGRDRITVEAIRHQTFPNQKDRDQPHQVYGATRSVIEMSLNNKNAGQYGVVVQHVKSAAAAALKDL